MRGAGPGLALAGESSARRPEGFGWCKGRARGLLESTKLEVVAGLAEDLLGAIRFLL